MCPSVLGLLCCTRSEPHVPGRGCVYVATDYGPDPKNDADTGLGQ
jgi:hypothetical protein